jgi:hypothetical protein
MKKYLYALLMSAICLAGCSKEKVPFALDGTYQLGPTVSAANPIKLYTKDGIMEDPALIDRFLARRQYLVNAAIFARSDAPSPYANPVTLTIEGSRAVLVVSRSYATKFDTSRAEITSRTDRSFVVTGFDSTTIGNNDGSHCATLVEQMHSPHGGHRCVKLPPASGFSSFCFVRPMWVVITKDGKLFAPQLSWFLQASPPLAKACTYSYSREWDLFNPAVRSQLLAGDTLVVQEREIALLKK